MAPAADALGVPEDIMVYYGEQGELDPPRPYTLKTLLFQQASDGVFVLTMNNPKALNSWSLLSTTELVLAAVHVSRDDRVRVIIWTGAGRAFSAGAALGSKGEVVPEDIMKGYVNAGIVLPKLDLALAAFTRCMLRMPKISIAAVNGITIGGAVNLALVLQDLVYVADTATFRYPFMDLGISPELGSSFLLGKIVGLTRAKELLLLGEQFSAQRALELGLCNAVVPQNEVLAAALAAAKRLAAGPAPALRETKRILNRELLQMADGATEAENETIVGLLATPETQQMLKKAMAAHKKTSKL